MRRIVWALIFCASAIAVASPVSKRWRRHEFFGSDKIYLVQIRHWNPRLSTPQTLSQIIESQTYPGSEFDLYISDPGSSDVCKGQSLLKNSKNFELDITGKTTRWAPKSSYKFKLKDGDFLGLEVFNLKGMWYDLSQMREALAWSLFQRAGVAASQQTYVRLCIESEGTNRYFGLYSMVEHQDKNYLKARIQGPIKGNLYSANYQDSDIGAANLRYMTINGLDGGSAYHTTQENADRSYSLKNFSKDPANETYDDLAKFIKILNGRDVSPQPLREYFESTAFKNNLESVFDVQGFLKWAAMNTLLGAWDNYWGMPQNYSLYNHGTLKDPHFYWLPWDYDATLGFGAQHWETGDILDWEKDTESFAYYYGDGALRADLPLIRNVLTNPDYRAQYLENLSQDVREVFTEAFIDAESKRIWTMIRPSVFAEVSATGENLTGRQYPSELIEKHNLIEDFVVNEPDRFENIRTFARARRRSVIQQLNARLHL